ncbi:hypothetical protein M8J76_004024 [Diaphorina citri]|nr:hypothetical protein M8J75_009181 [Diaphorina citri]KAI5744644.1 hypothetical protein M8J76_004024 [Diaphorina citri]KAI5752432.1 hypothetical protein M8J77_016961 [Diaphorina citri]
MFKFNFNNDEDPDDGDVKDDSPAVESKEFKPIDEILTNIISELDKQVENLTSVSNIKLLRTPLFEYETFVNISHTDLKPNVYEGGYKIWECTFDLLNFTKDNVAVDKLSVLDVGCGAGLLGLYTLMNGAAHVSFQDYNQEVIESLTLPNILMNTDNLEKCKFYHGDWGSLSAVIHSKFDIILTSETIYSVANYNKLLTVFKTLLKPTGCVYLAAKVYYFGVGGCVYDFEKLLVENNFLVDTVWEQNEGVKRKIIKIQPPPEM